MTAIERTNVLLEDMRTQNRVTYEALSGQIQALDRRIGERFDQLEERVTLLENVVRKLYEEVHQLRVDVNQLRSDFDKRAELSRLDALERRVALLEKRRPH